MLCGPEEKEFSKQRWSNTRHMEKTAKAGMVENVSCLAQHPSSSPSSVPGASVSLPPLCCLQRYGGSSRGNLALRIRPTPAWWGSRELDKSGTHRLWSGHTCPALPLCQKHLPYLSCSFGVFLLHTPAHKPHRHRRVSNDQRLTDEEDRVLGTQERAKDTGL